MATGSVKRNSAKLTDNFDVALTENGFSGTLHFYVFGGFAFFTGNFYCSSEVAANAAPILVGSSKLSPYKLSSFCNGMFIGYGDSRGNIQTDGYNITMSPRTVKFNANTYTYVFGACGLEKQ